MAVTGDTLATDSPQPLARAVATAGRWRMAGLAIVGAELAVLYAPTLQWLFDRWTLSVWHHAHGLFIPPLVIWFARDELKRRPELCADEGTTWGFVFLVPALLLHALDAGIHTQLLSAFSLVLALPGLSLLFLGWPRTKLILFPLAFTLFALPIPLALTEPVHLVLRYVTAIGTAAMLPYVGQPVYIEGTSLWLTNGRLNIVEACSGFSTLYASLAVACLTAYSSRSTRRRILVLALAAPIAMASNVLRITLLCVLIVHYGFGVLDSFLHPLTGMLTFAIALPLIFWLGGSTKVKAAQ